MESVPPIIVPAPTESVDDRTDAWPTDSDASTTVWPVTRSAAPIERSLPIVPFAPTDRPDPSRAAPA
eukprot:3360742-Pleurochrysis_carterae.AAC.1